MTLHRALTVFLALVVATTAVAQAPAPPAPPPRTDARVAVIAAMSREAQRDPAVQQELVHYFRQGTVLYLHHLDKLAPRQLFSLGDEPRFVAAIGTTDGTDHNRIFVAPAKSPHHVDQGPYVLPPDFMARTPIAPTLNTYWHEVQHDLLDRAGVGINPRPYGESMDTPAEATGLGSMTSLTADYHHPIIEGLGQRGADAYGRLAAFEEAARAAHAEQRAIERAREPTLAELRHIWSVSHQRFSLVTQAWGRVARLPEETVAAYHAATGIHFSPPEELATFYQAGVLKSGGPDGSNVGEDVRVPKWVFYPTLIRMPVRIHVIEDPPAPPGKETHLTRTFTVEVYARGSMQELDVRPKLDVKAISRPLTDGLLRVTLEGGDAQAVVRVDLPKGTVRDVSSRHREVKLNGEAMKLTFHVPDVRREPGPVTYTVHLDFADDTREPLFDTAERRIEIEVDPPKSGPAAATTPKVSPPGAASAPPDPSAHRGYWKFEGIHLANWGNHITGDVQNPTAQPRRVRLRETMSPPHRVTTCAATYTWTDPNVRYAAGEPFTIGIHATLDEYAFHHDPRIWTDTPERNPRTCRLGAGLTTLDHARSGGDSVHFEVAFKEDGSIKQLSDQRTLSGVFPAPHVAHDGQRVGRFELNFYVGNGAWAAYEYFWVDEGPEEARVTVRIPASPSDAAPVPPPYDGKPIAPQELTGPRPPVVPPDDGARPRVPPTLFQPPGGDYRVVLPPGWRPLARVDGEYLYADPNNAYVLACPPRSRRYTGAFAEQRLRLAAELIRHGVGGEPEMVRYGPHDGLVVRGVEGGRDTTRVFVASEGRAVLFRVVAAPGVAPPLAPVLEEAFGTVQWVDGGPVTTPR